MSKHPPERKQRAGRVVIDIERREAKGMSANSRVRAALRAQQRQQWLFFFLGFIASAIASVPIGVWVNHIS